MTHEEDGGTGFVPVKHMCLGPFEDSAFVRQMETWLVDAQGITDMSRSISNHCCMFRALSLT
jgi:hypothetical protein